MRNRKYRKITFNNTITFKFIERSINLRQLQLIRQSLFFVSNFSVKSNRYIRKLCLVTSRSRANSQITRTTRHVLNEYAISGYLYAFFKGSW